MSTQLLLPGMEPGSIHNLFFAFQPDWTSGSQALALGEDFRSRNGLLGDLFQRSKLHVSLQPVGAYYDELPRDIVAKAKGAAYFLRAPPVEVRFDLAGSYPRPFATSPFVLHSQASQACITTLHSELGEAMRRHGLRRGVKRTVTPHMTLFYDGRTLRPAPIEPITWVARELVLIHSRVGLGCHEVLGRWPLRA